MSLQQAPITLLFDTLDLHAHFLNQVSQQVANDHLDIDQLTSLTISLTNSRNDSINILNHIRESTLVAYAITESVINQELVTCLVPRDNRKV